MSIALGPLGRNGEATGSINSSGKMAAMLVNFFGLYFSHCLLTLYPSSIGTAIRKRGDYSEVFPSKGLS